MLSRSGTPSHKTNRGAGKGHRLVICYLLAKLSAAFTLCCLADNAREACFSAEAITLPPGFSRTASVFICNVVDTTVNNLSWLSVYWQPAPGALLEIGRSRKQMSRVKSKQKHFVRFLLTEPLFILPSRVCKTYIVCLTLNMLCKTMVKDLPTVNSNLVFLSHAARIPCTLYH